MELYYEGTDITRYVSITEAVVRDVSGGRSDSLTLTLDRTEAWYQWQPQADDRISIHCDGYDSGTLFLNGIAPEGNGFRIFATGAKSSAGRKASRGYEGKTLGEIMALCAAECGMDYRIYGVEPGYRYPYLIREDESCAAFLSRLAKWEGAVLKTYSGRFTMISILAAQDRKGIQTLYLPAGQRGVSYQRLDNGRAKSLQIYTPYAQARAEDTGAGQGSYKCLCNIPARDLATAGRWARGVLLSENRGAERLRIERDFCPSWTAMERIDVAGGTDGEWLIDEVEHDLIEKTSTAVLLRCIRTVK